MPVVTKEQVGFMPYLSHIGSLDSFLGISMFWSEKLIILILYLQRLAMLLLWSLDWPVFFYARMNFMYGFLLDFSAHHNEVDALGQGTIFEGCQTICKIVWPVLCVPILLTWGCISLHRTMPLYYTRNIERILWFFIRVGILPWMNTLIRYFIMNQDGLLVKDPVTKWVTPISELGVFLLLVTISMFIYLSYKRSSRNILFNSRIRHEAFLRAREIEYKLRFSTTYRNERIWMIASYNFAAWPWSTIRGIVDTVLMLIMNFVPVDYGVWIACGILWLNFLYGFLFVSLYRSPASSYVEHVLNFAISLFSIFGGLQVMGVRMALLVDSVLDTFLFTLHGAAIALVLMMCFYFFWDSHTFSQKLADKRAKAKWERLYGKERGKFVEMNRVKYDSDSDEDDKAVKKKIEQEVFFQKREGDFEEGQDRFYIPKESSLFSLNASSPHVWPVNGVLINELLRRNIEDHLIDHLRAARRMLDRVSALHNTAVLVPIDELKTHVRRLQQCVLFMKRQRIEHHMNAIHPLQTTFEDLIEQFTFELRVFSGRSITVGHNARKMIEVSRYLRRRMGKRDRALALVSPLMRRVLIKLLALRLFIELVEERPAYLLPSKPGDEFKGASQMQEDIFGGSGSSDDSTTHGAQGVDAFLAEGDTNETSALLVNRRPSEYDRNETALATALAEGAARIQDDQEHNSAPASLNATAAGVNAARVLADDDVEGEEEELVPTAITSGEADAAPAGYDSYPVASAGNDDYGAPAQAEEDPFGDDTAAAAQPPAASSTANDEPVEGAPEADPFGGTQPPEEDPFGTGGAGPPPEEEHQEGVPGPQYDAAEPEREAEAEAPAPQDEGQAEEAAEQAAYLDDEEEGAVEAGQPDPVGLQVKEEED